MSPLIEKRALVCSYHEVQPDRDSGARRIFHLVEFLLEAGWTVTFLASDGVCDQRDVRRLQAMGIAVYDGYRCSLEQVVAEVRPELALIAFWRNADRYLQELRKISPDTRVIVDSVDLHFLRESRRIFAGAEGNNEFGMLDSKFAHELNSELNTYARADAVLTVSPKEADLINDLLSSPQLAVSVPDCEDLPLSAIPFAERRGIVCIGSFQHLPNVQAVRYLCLDIIPRLDKKLLAEHPVYIIGNALDQKVCELAKDLSNVRMVGWVPSVEPYLERARVSVVPLLFGAGTKRKLMQALAIGTPTVSTSIGVEGFDLADGKQVVIADNPAAFAEGVGRLLQDEGLWNDISRAGRESVARTNSVSLSRGRFSEVLDRVFSNPPKAEFLPYEQLIPRICEAVCEHVPPGATVLVVSKGDERLLDLGERVAWHFPRTPDGIYSGGNPADSDEAIAHLESLCALGAEYLVFPRTSFWWLRHYRDLKAHLERHHTLISENKLCVVCELRRNTGPTGTPVSRQWQGGNVNGLNELSPGEPFGGRSRLSAISLDEQPPMRPPIKMQPFRPGDVRLIAFYLPQFHPIPENDAWWGEGFTEWRNVAKAAPQFPGHYQPHVPADLGFYDLRVAETREHQAALAQQYGIHGFCYYHYWFSGKRLLERPFNEVLASGQPDFPFCLCWANDPWSRRWDGREADLLQAQTYSQKDDIKHIRALLPALSDPRAIKIDGKPVFLIYRGKHLPDAARTTDIWRQEVEKAGLKGLYLMAVETAWDVGWDATTVGFDAKVLFQPQFGLLMTHAARNGAQIAVPGKDQLQVYDYRAARREIANALEPVSYRRYESVFPGWDNTARVGDRAVVMHNSSPAEYEEWLREAVARAQAHPPEERVVFINAWNEWAEGCHLEPDQRHGHDYLTATANALISSNHPLHSDSVTH